MKNFQYFAPRSLEEALSLLSRYREQAKVLAGGTDLFLRMRTRVFQPDYVIDLKRIPELQTFHFDAEQGLVIGALTLHADLAKSDLVRERYAPLARAAQVVGSYQTRNRGTIGGNICNASPAADTVLPLLAYGGKARLASMRGTRQVPLEEFFLGPGKTCLQPDELLVEVQLPVPPPHTGGGFQRRTRSAMDIALVNACTVLTLDGEVCTAVRIALGAVAPTPLRAVRAEAVLRGQVITPTLIQEASEVARQEARPISDVRSSAEYRREMVRVLTYRATQEALEQAKR
ncbi:MAG: xanthine dehydrogenase family protein subunit M [Nitrospinota bacterium]|nr:MAG: xanthine dehydrogenase family protein subunit M [Nitrospinota bacterium]